MKVRRKVFNPVHDAVNKNWKTKITIKEALASIKKARKIGRECLRNSL